MATKSSAIKGIAQANLEGQELSVAALCSVAASCVKWCDSRLPAAPATGSVGHLFRSEALKVAAHAAFPFSCHTPFDGALVKAFQDFYALRNQLLSARPRKIPAAARIRRELDRPRSLLITDCAASLSDGALEPETGGFIDQDGMPPWDTWIDLIQVDGSYGPCCLLSWVPAWLADRVNFAIRVDAAQSLSWLVAREDNELCLHGWGEEGADAS